MLIMGFESNPSAEACGSGRPAALNMALVRSVRDGGGNGDTAESSPRIDLKNTC